MDQFTLWLDGMALRRLHRRGYAVLSPGFRGIALGAGVASGDPENLKVSLPEHGEIIALNHSTIDFQSTIKHAPTV